MLPTDIKRASATHFHGFIEFHSSRSTINVVILRRGISGMHLSYPDLLQSSLGDIMVQVTQANNCLFKKRVRGDNKPADAMRQRNSISVSVLFLKIFLS